MSIEIDREHPCYQGIVPVRIEQDSSKNGEVSNTIPLTLRILPGVKKTAQGQRIGLMHMEITQDSDFFFLYTLQVSEEEFHQLKTEQSLLVDFASFPPKFVELLQACKAEGKESGQGKFLAILDLAGGLPTFKIVEANQFKQLTHLALRFQPGTDSSIKLYLASRLKMAQIESEERRVSLEKMNATLDEKGRSTDELQATILSLRGELDKVTDKLTKEFSATLSKQKEESIKLLSQTQNAAAEQARKQQETGDKRMQELEEQLSKIQKEHRALYEAKASVDSENKQLNIRLDTLDKFTRDGTTELEKLRATNREIERVKFELEKKVSEQQLSIAALRQQVQDKEEILVKTTTMLEQTGEKGRASDEKVNHYKSTTSKLQRKLELSIKEINKGNSVIEGLQNEVKQARDRIRTKNIVIRQQEKVVEETRNQLEDKDGTIQRLKEQLSNERSNVSDLTRALEISKEKLEESKKVLESNQNVINFLNKEINETHVGVSRMHLDTSPMTYGGLSNGGKYESKQDFGLEFGENFNSANIEIDLPDLLTKTGTADISGPERHVEDEQDFTE